MARLRATHLMGLALRLLLVAGCVLPLGGARVAAAAVAVGLPAPVVPGQLPAAPANEEEDEQTRDEAAGKPEAVHRADRRPDRHPPLLGRVPFSTVTVRAGPNRSRTSPTAADPFRNGLGSPYRC